MGNLLKVGTKVKLISNIITGSRVLKKGSECVIEYVDKNSFSPYYCHCEGVSVWLHANQVEVIEED